MSIQRDSKKSDEVRYKRGLRKKAQVCLLECKAEDPAFSGGAGGKPIRGGII
ncbi:hypothetical protein [Fictibacillus terranigra]|uniref:Uncharacterized protein n=1 Tax=Fictibacillus terranigra TaxID=3058424 RepID=A0ABT8E557_9BACL|nr:hypothetical protein [Fictibacillus sp. CENA-BCM004]MDN4073049.1 hypothetical protein [Fictibacillus sp. CENA-BCM004]